MSDVDVESFKEGDLSCYEDLFSGTNNVISKDVKIFEHTKSSQQVESQKKSKAVTKNPRNTRSFSSVQIFQCQNVLEKSGKNQLPPVDTNTIVRSDSVLQGSVTANSQSKLRPRKSKAVENTSSQAEYNNVTSEARNQSESALFKSIIPNERVNEEKMSLNEGMSNISKESTSLKSIGRVYRRKVREKMETSSYNVEPLYGKSKRKVSGQNKSFQPESTSGNRLEIVNLTKEVFPSQQPLKLSAADDNEEKNLSNLNESESFVPLYNSNDSIHTDEPEQPQTKKTKKQKVRHNCIMEKVFLNQLELRQFFEEEQCWGYHYENKPEEGRKVHYRCKLNKARSEPCASRIYIFYDSTSDEIVLYRNDAAHTHEEKPVGIPEDVKILIQKMFALKIKAGTMLLNIAKENLPVPDIIQVRNYIAILKREKYGAATISLGELLAWLQKNSEIPDDEFEPFVLSYNVWGTELDDNDRGFRFFITSKHLLLQSSKGHAFHSDTTYKAIWQRFPVLFAGKSDMNQSFHPSGISVTIEEKEEDFEFIFRAIKDGLYKIHNIDIKPTALVADAAGAIRNGFKNVFGDTCVIIMCWFHLKKAVVPKVKELCDKINHDAIIDDIDKLQLAPSVEIFQNALEGFLDKWQNREKEFIEYFQNEWVHLNPNWFEGILKFTPTTNNPQEAFHKVFKSHHTFRERQSLAHFLTSAMDIVRDWSIQYKNNIKTFATETKVDLPLWTKSYDWAKLNKAIKCTTYKEFKEYRIPAIEEHVVTDTSFNTFDEYKSNAFKTYNAMIDKINWRKSTCSCPAFFKNFLCKHILGILLRTKVLTAPPEAKNVPIGEKRKRGRPAKAKKALIVQ